MVGEGVYGGESSGFLVIFLRGSGDEDIGVFVLEIIGVLLFVGFVLESFLLSGEVVVFCWDVDEEGVILFEYVWVFEDGDICGFRRSVYFGEDFVRKSFGDFRCFIVSMFYDLKGR